MAKISILFYNLAFLLCREQVLMKRYGKNPMFYRAFSERQRRSGPTNNHLVMATTSILDALDINDLGQVSVNTYNHLPRESYNQVQDIKKRLPTEVLESTHTLTGPEMERGVAQLLNEIPTKSLHRIGPKWLKIVPALPEGTWQELNPKVIDNIPWQGLVANLDPSIWGQMSPTKLNLLPDRWWSNVPPEVLSQIPPETFFKIEPDHINLLRQSQLRSFQWEKIYPSLSAEEYQALSPRIKDNIPWRRLVSKLDPSVWGEMPYEKLDLLPDIWWQRVPRHVLNQIPAETIAEMGPERLNLIPVENFKALKWKEIATEVDGNFYNGLDNQHGQMIPWKRICKTISQDDMAELNTDLLQNLLISCFSIPKKTTLRPNIVEQKHTLRPNVLEKENAEKSENGMRFRIKMKPSEGSSGVKNTKDKSAEKQHPKTTLKPHTHKPAEQNLKQTKEKAIEKHRTTPKPHDHKHLLTRKESQYHTNTGNVRGYGTAKGGFTGRRIRMRNVQKSMVRRNLYKHNEKYGLRKKSRKRTPRRKNHKNAQKKRVPNTMRRKRKGHIGKKKSKYTTNRGNFRGIGAASGKSKVKNRRYEQ